MKESLLDMCLRALRQSRVYKDLSNSELKVIINAMSNIELIQLVEFSISGENYELL